MMDIKRTTIFLYVLLGVIFMGCGLEKEVETFNTDQDKQKVNRLCDIIGCTHVAGKYYLTNKDYLNEGADRILMVGSRVIKIWFYGKRHEHPENVYGFNSEWPRVESLVQGAQLPYFKTLFDKPFTTYILVVTSLGRADDYWRNGITEADQRDEQRQFYELARYCLPLTAERERLLFYSIGG